MGGESVTTLPPWPHDHRLDDVDLNKLLQGYQVNKLSLEQAESLEGPLTHKEISLSLKQMENNKSLGIDGFPAEFLKMFWKECMGAKGT